MIAFSLGLIGAVMIPAGKAGRTTTEDDGGCVEVTMGTSR
jgi:hypothetical protein